MTPTLSPGDVIRAPDAEPPGWCFTGEFVGLSNASGELRVCIRTISGAYVWCRAAEAVVLSSRHPASPSGGGAPKDPPKEGGP